MMPASRPAALAVLALIAGATAMGASPVFVREAEVGPFVSAFWRVALGLPLLVLWAARETRPARWPWGAMVLSGLFFSGDLIFWHLAILNTTMANATLMACLAPVWVLVLSGATIGERVPRRSFAGLGLCLAGAALLVGSSLRVDPSRVVGDAYGLVTSLFFGLYFLAMRFGRRHCGGGLLVAGSTAVTALVLLAAALIATAVTGGPFLPASASGYGALAALGVVSHAGGQGLLAFALGVLSAAFSSLVIFLEALAAAVFGWWLFEEALGPLQIAGGVLILAGIVLARPGGESPAAPGAN